MSRVCLGAYVLYESTLYAAMLVNPNAGYFYPLNATLMLIGELMRCPYIFWGPYLMSPFIGLALVVNGVAKLSAAGLIKKTSQ